MNAIDLEVIYQSTLQIARELTMNMLRTGYSTIIKESQDFTFAVFDARGRMVAQGIPQPLHIGPLAAQIQEIRRLYRGKIEPGSGKLPAPEEVRRVYFDSQSSLAVPAYRRTLLEPGVRIQGPAVIEEKTSTTVLYPGQRARVDDYLNIEVELEASE